MYTGKTLFAQLMDFLPWTTFTRHVTRYGGDQGIRKFACAEQYRAMAFAQLTYRATVVGERLRASRKRGTSEVLTAVEITRPATSRTVCANVHQWYQRNS